MNFVELKDDKIKEVRESSATALVIFSDKGRLHSLKSISPCIKDAQGINIIYKNRQTYIFFKIDKERPLDERIAKLFWGC